VSEKRPHPTALRVQERLRERGLEIEVRTLDASTRSAAEAAEAVTCDEGQIVKSLVFIVDGRPTIFLCAGDPGSIRGGSGRMPGRRRRTRFAKPPDSRSVVCRRSATIGR
jgi:hypothetical protein